MYMCVCIYVYAFIFVYIVHMYLPMFTHTINNNNQRIRDSQPEKGGLVRVTKGGKLGGAGGREGGEK